MNSTANNLCAFLWGYDCAFCDRSMKFGAFLNQLEKTPAQPASFAALVCPSMQSTEGPACFTGSLHPASRTQKLKIIVIGVGTGGGGGGAAFQHCNPNAGAGLLIHIPAIFAAINF